MPRLSLVGERGPLFIVAHGLLILVASLVAEHQLQGHRLQYWWLLDLIAPPPVQSFWTWDQTHVACIGRQLLIHHTAKEVPASAFDLSVDRVEGLEPDL